MVACIYMIDASADSFEHLHRLREQFQVRAAAYSRHNLASPHPLSL